MSQLSKQDLKAENQLQFPNNNNGAITPANLRAFNVDLIDSTVNQTVFTNFSGSVADQFQNITASVDSSITGSSLITASFSGNTITFTKGDASTFGIVIPDVSGSTIDTGSFATTGSNTFTGIQNFTNEITASHTLIDGDLTVTPTTSTKLNGNTDVGAFLFVNGGLTLNNTAEITWLGTGIIGAGFSASVDARINAITGGAAINTGSFATTGSNAFIGNQTITGSLLISGSQVVTGPLTASRLQINGITDLNGVLDVLNNATFRGDVIIQSSGEQKLLMRSTSGGGVSQGFDLLIQTSSFIIRDETHDIDFLEFDYISSSGDHILKLEANRFELNSGSLGVSGSLTASLEEGYVWVGGVGNKSIAFQTASLVLNIDTGSFATTGSNTFIGNQIISGNIDFTNNLFGGFIDIRENDGAIFFRSSGSNVIPDTASFWSINSQFQVGDLVFVQQPSNDKVISLGLDNRYVTFYKGIDLDPAFEGFDVFQTPLILSSSFGGQTQILNVIGDVSASNLHLTGTLTASLAEGFVLVGGAGNITTLVATSSFGGGGGGTTYENPTLNTYSGSLILAGNGFTSASFDYISASQDGLSNLIFRSANAAVTTVISGSNNILGTYGNVLAGFRRQVTTGNIANYVFSPQVSASMAFDVFIDGNIFNSALNLRGPVSASSWQISSNTIQGAVNIGAAAAANHARGLDDRFVFNSNTINGLVNVVANGASIRGGAAAPPVTISGNTLAGGTINIRQSGINALNNYGGGFIVNNDYFSGSAGFGQVGLAGNNLQGNNIINFSGSLDSGVAANGQPGFGNNIVFGSSNIFRLDATGRGLRHSIIGTGVIGSNLILTGSSDPTATGAATQGGMIVGRFNAVDGTRANSAETVFAVGTGTAAATRKTGFLIDSGSNTFVEGTLNVSGSMFLNGSQLNRLNGQTFYATLSQSGSANVSQSIQFDASGSGAGINLVSGTQLQVANAGLYSLNVDAHWVIDIFGGDEVNLWVMKNGTNIANSAQRQLYNGSLNIVDQAAANDYYEFVWEGTLGDAILQAYTGSGASPDVPGAIATITQIN